MSEKKIEHLYLEEGFPKQKGRKKSKVKAKDVFGTWSLAKADHSPRFLIPECWHWRQKFDLEDGLHVFASAWFDKPQTGADSKNHGFAGRPDIGFYLDGRWATGSLLVSPGFTPPFGKGSSSSRIVIYPWEDWGVPQNPQLFRRALRWLLSEAGRGKRIEIGCIGGHGRTGTTLACLLVIQGISPTRAMNGVWSRYCDEAIDSRKQLDYIRQMKDMSSGTRSSRGSPTLS